MIFSKKKLTQGEIAEKEAQRFLVKQGLKLKAQNYRCRQGEIDLVMEDSDTLVFVEVRYRSNPNFGSALESVTPSKQNKIRLAAQHYIVENHQSDAKPMRFDVVGMGKGDFDWIKNAF